MTMRHSPIPAFTPSIPATFTALIPALILATSAFAQMSETTVSGRVGSGGRGSCGDSLSPRPDSLRILLREVSTSQIVQETRADADGRYRFRHVAFASYTLEAWNGAAPWVSLPIKVDAPLDAVDLP